LPQYVPIPKYAWSTAKSLHKILAGTSEFDRKNPTGMQSRILRLRSIKGFILISKFTISGGGNTIMTIQLEKVVMTAG
jgi:hypothetical protein